MAEVVAGDNLCESAISSTKRALRRTNQLGRTAPLMQHIHALSARRLQREPGLTTVLQALGSMRGTQKRAWVLPTRISGGQQR